MHIILAASLALLASVQATPFVRDPISQPALLRRDISSFPSSYPDLSNCGPALESCTVAPSDSCCGLGPNAGGLQLQTQFWSTYTGLESSVSPDTHSLWPDFCNGSYTSYCDLSRQYDPQPSPNVTSNGTVIPPYNGSDPITPALLKYGRDDLLEYIQNYWIAQGQPNWYFWSHEVSKHATCTSTFDTRCYKNGTADETIVDFVAAVVRAFQLFPSHDILAASGIVPSNSTNYTLAQIQSAFQRTIGVTPYIGCSGPGSSGKRTILSELWWYNYVVGTPQLGQFIYINSTSPSSCSNSSSIMYPLRASGSEHSVTNGTSSSS